MNSFFCKKGTDTIFNKKNDQTQRLVFDDLPNLILGVCTRFQLYLQAPTLQVTEDFEVAYARAVRHYKRNLRLRRIQIVLRISLGLVLLGVLGIAACLFATLTSTSSSPPILRPTTQKTSTSPIITETSNQPTTTTAITEPTPTSKGTTTIHTTAITTSTSTRSPSTTSLTEVTTTSPLPTSAYRPIPIPYSGKNKALKTLQSGQIRLDLFPN